MAAPLFGLALVTDRRERKKEGKKSLFMVLRTEEEKKSKGPLFFLFFKKKISSGVPIYDWCIQNQASTSSSSPLSLLHSDVVSNSKKWLYLEDRFFFPPLFFPRDFLTDARKK